MGIDAQMLVKTKFPITPDEVRDLAYRLGDAFWPDAFFIIHPLDPLWLDERPCHCLEIIDVYTQDGPDIYPEPDETLIEVHLLGRFYGPEYERGNLPLFLAIADWLERNIPQSEVWYGGNSSGICAKRLDQEARARLWEHFCSVGHLPYAKSWHTNATPSAPVCPLCQIPMEQYGSGRGGLFASWVCLGCGLRLETNDGGETITGTINDRAISWPVVRRPEE